MNAQLAGKLPFETEADLGGSVMRIHLDKTKPIQTPRRDAIHAWVFL
jgi:hypothetical protein